MMTSIARLFDLPYTDHLINHYAALADLEGFVLLTSGDCSQARYDIVSACPHKQFSCDSYQAVHRFPNDLQRAMVPVDECCDLPFQGGLIGYFTYEFGAALMGIPLAKRTVFNATQSCLAYFGLYDWAIIVDRVQKKITLLVANQNNNTETLIKDEIIPRWNKPQKLNPIDIPKMNACILRSQYNQSFQAIHTALRQGRCYQVNYTQPFMTEYHGDTWPIFATLQHSNKVPFSAYLRGGKQDLLSFSPERFLWYDNRTHRLLTSPIKGTIRRSLDSLVDATLKQTLLNCEKNRAENTMIVDLLRNDLSKIARRGSVQVTALCALESYRSVHHLVSTIEALRCTQISPLMAFLSCFPGGSITGAPKREAMRIIYEQEPYARGAYCGSIGYFSLHGNFDSSIAIRTLIAENGLLSLAAGGGIVIDSQCEEEYAECLVKIQSLK